MSNRPDPNKRGWHAPENAGEWRSMVKVRPKRSAKRPAVLLNKSQVDPLGKGLWRLPRSAETTARPAPTTPRPEDALPTKNTDPTRTAPRPEDFTPTAPGKTTAPRPEDLTINDTAAQASSSVPRPEDFTALGDETVSAAPDNMPTQEVEFYEDDDPFGVSELLALQSLAEETTVDAELGETVTKPVEAADQDEPTVQLSDLSAAEIAAMQASQLGDDPNATTVGTATGTADTFDYDAQLAGLDNTGGLDYSGGQPPVTGTADAFDYDAQLAGLGDIPPMGQTEALGETPADPQTTALISQFEQVEVQIRDLRMQRDQGLIPPQQLDSLVRELLIFDPREQTYWMMGIDTEIWYKFNNFTQQWEVAEPPHRQSPQTQYQSAVPTDTSSFTQAQVDQLGSLPAVDQQDSYYAPTTDYVPPDQVPHQDPSLTMVADAAYRDVLPGSEPTVQSMSAVGVETLDDDYIPADQQIEAPLDDGLGDDEEPVGDVVERARREQQRSFMTMGVVTLIVIVGIVLLGGAAVIVGGTLWYRSIADRWATQIAGFGEAVAEPEFQTVIIEDFEGNELARLRSQQGGDRTTVVLEDVSPFLIHAVVSTENETFFSDPGFSLRAIGRAFLQNISGGEVVSGGSTITQQLARNIVFEGTTFSSEADRKLNEVVVAAELSRLYDKNRILEVYLNDVYFGNQKYGVEAASEFYFEDTSGDVNIAESALLAGLIQAPAATDPVTNPQAAFDRMDQVLRLMTESGGGSGCLPIPFQAQPVCVTSETLRAETAVDVANVKVQRYLPEQLNVEHPHFVTFVQEQLQTQFTQEEIFRRGFRVRTTMIPSLQNAAEEALRISVDSLSTTGVNTGTVMVTDPTTGAILAMIGSPDFNDETIDGQVNLALSWQQPGSAIKPIVYTAALAGVQTEGGPAWYTPATVLWDVPVTYSDGTPIVNFDNEYHGPVSVRTALQNSYNVPAVKAYNFIGDANFLQVSQAMGLRFLDEAVFGPPTGVGATDVRLYDMMKAYGTLANNGTLAPLFAIESIEDFQGNPVEWERATPQQAVSPQVAYLMQNIMSDDPARQIEFPPNNNLAFSAYPGRVAAKTGTSSGNRDLWTMGFTENRVVGVWLGTVDNTETFNTSGYLAASPLWNQIMREVMNRRPPERDFQNPASAPQGVVVRQVCVTTGALFDETGAIPCNNVRSEFVLNNQPPPNPDQGFLTTVRVNTWTQLIANDFCPNDVQQVTVANIGDPTAIAWLNDNASGQATARALGLPVPIPQPPAGACDASTQLLQAGITSPAASATVIEPIVRVEGSIASAQNFSSYDIQISNDGGQTFQIISGANNTLPAGQAVLGEWDATNAPNGTYTLRLAINNSNGGFAYRDVTFTLNKPLPTATPTVAPTPSPPPLGGGVGGGTTGGGLGAPTPTLIPFGD